MLNADDKKKILVYARGLLKARLTAGPEPHLAIAPALAQKKCGIFVTLKLRGGLRGCIGNMAAREPLEKSLREMTLAAAFHDPRFPPLTFQELASVKIHISILTEPAPVQSYRDVRAGTDGIIVTSGWKKGVYLPEVATELDWDSKTFFESCALEKAGLTEEELKEAAIEVFQTEKFGEEGS